MLIDLYGIRDVKPGGGITITFKKSPDNPPLPRRVTEPGGFPTHEIAQDASQHVTVEVPDGSTFDETKVLLKVPLENGKIGSYTAQNVYSFATHDREGFKLVGKPF